MQRRRQQEESRVSAGRPAFIIFFSICVMEILPNALSPHKQARYVYSFVFFGEWHIEADGQDAQLQPQEDLPLRLSEIIL